MNRALTFMLLVFIACVPARSAFGDDHHKEWLEFLEGTWNLRIPKIDEESVATYTRKSDGNAMLARFDHGDGTGGAELIGWDSNREIVLVTGYGSDDGNFWRIEFNEITDDTMSGSHTGRLPDGTAYKNQVKLEKKDDDHIEWHSVGKSGEGEEVSMDGYLTRISSSSGPGWSKEQMSAWSALKEQVSLGQDREWDEHEKYIHSKLSAWGDDLPSPVSFDGMEYWMTLEDHAPPSITHHLVPVNVVVVDDVAIINAYLHVLKKAEDEPAEVIYRLHNTWKKADGQWRLLATYNTLVSNNDDD